MKDVARAAGVGLGTVSRVFSKQGSVSEATRQRVEEAAERLNYFPSAIGRGLKQQRTNNIGLIVADISNHFYGEFTETVLRLAKERGQHVIVCASEEDPATERDYIELLVQQRVEGVIAFPTGGNHETWNRARGHDIDVVFVDRTVQGVPAPSVTVDNVAGARALTEYLLALGHQVIGYLGGPLGLTSGREREEGYRAALQAAGTPIAEELVVRGRFTRETAYASALRLLSLPTRPTAILASNNVLGEAAVAAVQSQSLQVPEDISVVMIDDVPWAKLIRPGMTVLAQPIEQMAYAAVRLIDDAGSSRPRASQRLRTDLIIRGSACPPRIS